MGLSEVISIETEDEVAEAIASARSQGNRLRVRGGGTRLDVGRASQTNQTLDVSAMRGITLYEPSEMVIGAWAGTPLREIEDTLAAKGQMLTCEPTDYRALMGTEGEPTIGAVVAMNNSGPRRIYGGAARDSLIGVRFVNGRGEIIKNGGRVMKNVTGLDLVKLQAGAWGTLGVLTEVIFKVLPSPETVQTLLLEDLSDEKAIEALCAAVGTPFEITGAAHLPAHDELTARTLIRLEGMENSVVYRTGKLTSELAKFGEAKPVSAENAQVLWRQIRDVEILSEPRGTAIWRVSLPPTAGADFAKQIGDGKHYFDWSGGLVWLALPENYPAEKVQQLAESLRGHATLVRANAQLRSTVSVFQPQPAAIAQLSAGIKSSFDPDNIINPGLMVAEG